MGLGLRWPGARGQDQEAWDLGAGSWTAPHDAGSWALGGPWAPAPGAWVVESRILGPGSLVPGARLLVQDPGPGLLVPGSGPRPHDTSPLLRQGGIDRGIWGWVGLGHGKEG